MKYDGSNISSFTQEYSLTKADTKGNSLEIIFAIGEDDLENIWFGTYESGVWRYNGEEMTNFTREDEIESEQVWTIYKSKRGEMWFGRANPKIQHGEAWPSGINPSGVYKFNGDSFERKF